MRGFGRESRDENARDVERQRANDRDKSDRKSKDDEEARRSKYAEDFSKGNVKMPWRPPGW